jgi:hypothetical protein
MSGWSAAPSLHPTTTHAMYAEITIIATFDRGQFSRALIEQIGSNSVLAETALKGTIFELSAANIGDRIVAAERITDVASILYFFEGTDTITAHVAARTVSQLKAQAVRITRQMRRLFTNGCTAKVLIFTQEGWDQLIVEGEYVSRWRHFRAALSEKLLGKLLTPAIVFFLAVMFFAGTPAVSTAVIALLAAGISFTIEAAAFAYTAEDWKWRDAR